MPFPFSYTSKVEVQFDNVNHTPDNLLSNIISALKKVKVRNIQYYFGKARQTSSSRRIYKTPWQGDPRINIQNYKGKAKAYQVKQVLMAIQKLEDDYVS